MDPLLVTILLRMAERIGDVVIGGLALYFGYTLFLKFPDIKDAKGEIKWRDASVLLSRIGPGIFFALFGVTVTLVSLFNPIRIGPYAGSTLTAQPTSDLAFSGVAEGHAAPIIPPEKIAAIQTDIALLNSFEGQLTTLDDKDQRDFDLALPRVKLAMIESIWNEEAWSDRALFRQKVLNYEIDCANAKQDSAEDFFCYGSSGGDQ